MDSTRIQTDEELQRVRQLQAEAHADYAAAQARREALSHLDNPDRATRRAKVRHLAQQEPPLSHRAIAARLGVSKDTVRRDLAQTALPAAQTGAPDAVETYVPLDVHPALVGVARDVRQLAQAVDALAHDAAHRRFVLAAMARFVDILERLAPVDPVQQIEVGVLARRLQALADHTAHV